MSAETEAAAPFSTRTVAIIVAVGLIAFSAIFVMSAWAPELARKDASGPHPYSKSATGFAGIVDLLRQRGDSVTVSRTETLLTDREGGLMVVTPPPGGRSDLYAVDDLAGPALIVLPKWIGARDPDRKQWERDTFLSKTSTPQSALRVLDPDGDIWRIRSPARLETPFGDIAPSLGDDMQVIRSDTLEPLIETPVGALLARLPGRDVYVLADPDLISTFGLADFETARAALGLVDWLGAEEVIFDATLHGFTRSDTLLRLLLDVPFIGATLVALSAVALLGWAASVRFGSPVREGPAIALGKTALADNSAGLVAMARRETRLAPNYLALSERAAAKALGAPRSLHGQELAGLIDRLGGDDPEVRESWTALKKAMDKPAASRDDLVKHARALYRRRQEITHGHL